LCLLYQICISILFITFSLLHTQVEFCKLLHILFSRFFIQTASIPLSALETDTNLVVKFNLFSFSRKYFHVLCDLCGLFVRVISWISWFHQICILLLAVRDHSLTVIGVIEWSMTPLLFAGFLLLQE